MVSRAKLKKRYKRYRWDTDLMMLVKKGGKKYGDRLVPEASERGTIIQEVHRYGHMEVNRVAASIVENYFWSGMKKNVRKVIKECSCTANKLKLTVTGSLKPTPMPMAPFDLVAIDLMTLTRSYSGNRYLITAQDYLSKWPEAKAVPQKTAAAVASFIEENISSRFGCPVELVSDQGREFLRGQQIVDSWTGHPSHYVRLQTTGEWHD